MKKLKKVLVLFLACLMIVGTTVAGTLAWLTAQTEKVVNTFTVGDINLKLLEHDLKEDGTLDLSKEVTENDNYKFVPGDTLPKDPWVVVEKDSEACYLFIHVVETNNTTTNLNGKIINWSVDETTKGWKKVEINETVVPGYWYQEITSVTEADKDYSILTDNQVTVNENVTKGMVDAINKAKPTLTFTAAAVQMDNIVSVEAAWKQLPSEFTTSNP